MSGTNLGECRSPTCYRTTKRKPKGRLEEIMPTYITLINWTDQGIRNVKDSPNRFDAGKKMAKELGGAMKEVYLTMGTYDLVVISEFPSDEAGAKFTLAVGSGGNIRSTTLKAFPETEYREIIASLL
jgi:uncharacterized protein with GYD domain